MERYVEQRSDGLWQRCYSCHRILSETEYHRDRMASYGIKGTCKQCAKRKRDNDQQRQKKLAKKREYYRKNKDRWVGYRKRRKIVKYRSTKAIRARKILNQAIIEGRVTKPKCCSECLRPCPKILLHAHHDNYDRPYDVIWLCSSCHGKKHRG